MPRGRKSKFKPEMIDDAEKLATLGFTEENIATYWGVSFETLRRWKRKDEDLTMAINKGRLNANLSVTKKLFEKCQGGNMTAMIFWLTNRCPEHWADRRAMINNINVNRVHSGDSDKEVKRHQEDIREQLRTLFEE